MTPLIEWATRTWGSFSQVLNYVSLWEFLHSKAGNMKQTETFRHCSNTIKQNKTKMLQGLKYNSQHNKLGNIIRREYMVVLFYMSHSPPIAISFQANVLDL